MLEKWKLSKDKKGFSGGILVDLSKAFNTINRPLLLAKLHTYRFSKQALAVICSYCGKDLIFGVRQGSVREPLLFNIYLNDLFFFLKNIDICNFADDTATYISDESLENVLESLEKNSMLHMPWFGNIKLNTDICHLIVSGYKHEQLLANIRIEIFDKNVLKFCSKANQKICSLSRMAKLLSFNKRKKLFKAFEESQFKYCQIVWIFHS